MRSQTTTLSARLPLACPLHTPSIPLASPLLMIRYHHASSYLFQLDVPCICHAAHHGQNISAFPGARTFLSAATFVAQRCNKSGPCAHSREAADRNVRTPLNTYSRIDVARSFINWRRVVLLR